VLQRSLIVTLPVTPRKLASVESPKLKLTTGGRFGLALELVAAVAAQQASCFAHILFRVEYE
jgi:hypothetical protein